MTKKQKDRWANKVLKGQKDRLPGWGGEEFKRLKTKTNGEIGHLRVVLSSGKKRNKRKNSERQERRHRDRKKQNNFIIIPDGKQLVKFFFSFCKNLTSFLR